MMLASIAARNATLIPSGVRTQAASHTLVCKDTKKLLEVMKSLDENLYKTAQNRLIVNIKSQLFQE